MTIILSSHLISDNWKFPKVSTSQQIKNFIFACITSHFPHLPIQERFNFSLISHVYLRYSVLLRGRLHWHLSLGVCAGALVGPFYWGSCYLFVVWFGLGCRCVSGDWGTGLAYSVARWICFSMGGPGHWAINRCGLDAFVLFPNFLRS